MFEWSSDLQHPICSACSCFCQHLCFSICFRWISDYPWKSTVLMLKPSVGLTVLTSSFMTRFTIVVFPALSRPLYKAISEMIASCQRLKAHSIKIRISLSFSRAFRRIDNIVAKRLFQPHSHMLVVEFAMITCLMPCSLYEYPVVKTSSGVKRMIFPFQFSKLRFHVDSPFKSALILR